MRDKAQDALDAVEHLAVAVTAHGILLPFALAGRLPTEVELQDALEPLSTQDPVLASRVASWVRSALDKARRLGANNS